MYQEQSFEGEFDNLETLIRRFENMLQGKSREFIDEDSFVRIVDYYDEKEDLPRAIEAANMGMEHFPFCADLQIKKAALLNAAGQFDRALSLLENAEILNPSDINHYIHKIDACLGLNKTTEARRIFRKSVNRFSGEEQIDLLLDLNEVFGDWDAADEAFDCLALLLKKYPENVEGLERISFWAECTGRIGESIKLHQQIIDEHPFNAQAWFNLGSSFQEIKLYEKAIDAYEYALAIDEHFEAARRYLADAYIRLRKYDKAIEALKELQQQRNTEDRSIYEALGYCYEKKKKYAKARFCYHRALRVETEEDSLYFRIGHTYMLEDLWKQALPFITSASRKNPGKVEYHLALGECYVQLDQSEAALEQFMRSIEIKPSGSRPRLALIQLLFDMGCYEEALQQLEIAVFKTRHLADYNYYRCAILLELGKTKEALLQLEIALNEAPRKLKVLFAFNPAILQHEGVKTVLARFD